MKGIYKKYKFSTISFKINVASRFRKFSKQIFKSNTEALEAMLNFFERNDLSPEDDLGVKNERTNKRINAVIAILKNIEKHQTKPTTIMLQSLFEEINNNKKEEENYGFETPKLITENEELTYYRDAYFKSQTELNEHKHKVNDFFEKFDLTKHTFSSNQYILKMTEQEFKDIKNSML